MTEKLFIDTHIEKSKVGSDNRLICRIPTVWYFSIDARLAYSGQLLLVSKDIELLNSFEC